MKQFVIILFSCIIFSLHPFAQDLKGKDSVTMTGNAMQGTRFYQHGEKINTSRLTEIIKVNSGAYTYLKKAKSNNLFSVVFGIAGGFLVGYELGSTIGGRDIDWAIMSSGAGAIGMSIPFSIGAKRNAKKAVDLYNSSLH